MHVIAVANHKGGVGKTTTTHELGAILAESGLSVVMIDMDPQSSLSESCLPGTVPHKSMVQVLARERPLPITDALIKVRDGLWLAPATLELAYTQRELAARFAGRDTALKKAIAGLRNVDLVIIDCPPSLDVLTLNALMAAEYVLIPTKPQIVDLRGLRLFLATLDEMRIENERLKIMGVLFTFFEGFNLHRRALSLLTDAGLPLMATRIGKSVRVAESPEVGQSVTEFSPTNPRATEYRNLATEVMTCLSQK